MNSTFDDEMRRVYAPLARDHERLREELMASLPEAPPCVESDARPVSRRRWTGWSVMKGRIVPVGIGMAAAVVLLVVGFWPGGGKNGLAWADVVRQIRAARTAHLRTVTRDPSRHGGRELVQDLYIKAPDTARLEMEEPSTERRKVIILNREGGFVLHPMEKSYEVTAGFQKDRAEIEDCLAMMGASSIESSEPGPQSRPVRLGDEQMQLVSVGIQERNGRRLHKYRLESAEQPEKAPDAGKTLLYCWFDPAKGQVVLMTYERPIDGTLTEIGRTDVAIDIELSDDLFRVPPNYTESGRSSAVRELNRLCSKYEQVREGIAHYRLIVWEDRMGKGYNPVARGARDGDRWRADSVWLPEVGMPQEFESLWSRLSPAPNDMSMYHSNGKDTRGLWYDGKLRYVRHSDDPMLSGYMLAGLGWPKWPAPLERTALDEKKMYRRLPDQPDRPGMIGVEYRQLPDSKEELGRLMVFWLDPGKDYLCVHHEDHWRYGAPWQNRPGWEPDEPVVAEQFKSSSYEYDRSQEIVEFGLTPDGHWYPKAVKKSGAYVKEGQRSLWGPVITRVQVEFTGPIAGELFEPPAEAREFKKK